MERDLHTPAPYDYRQYDRVWQRVAPNLDPYPEFRGAAAPAVAELRGLTAASPAANPPAATPASESQLPGADPDPCCMGTAAAELLEVIEGFIEAELSDRRYYAAFARQAPAHARQRLRDLGGDAASAARRLMAVYYLITGQCYQAAIEYSRIHVGHWCPALRERYHVEACNGLNYIRAAEGTTDPCLRRLLTDLSQTSYAHADQILALLERGMN